MPISYERARMMQRASKIIEEKDVGGYDEAIQLVGSDAANALLIIQLRKFNIGLAPKLPEAEIELAVFDRLSAAGIMS